MGCLEDRIKYNSKEKNIELAQKYADLMGINCVVYSKDNGKTWSFKPLTNYDVLIKPAAKPKPKAKAKK